MPDFEKFYKGNYYTIVGCGGDLNEWRKGYQKLLDDNNIGTIREWYSFTGKEINDYYRFEGKNRFADDLSFLAFPIVGLNVGKLAILKVRMSDHWFNDLVDNSKSFEEE